MAGSTRTPASMASSAPRTATYRARRRGLPRGGHRRHRPGRPTPSSCRRARGASTSCRPVPRPGPHPDQAARASATGVNITVGLPIFRTASTTARRSTSPAPARPTTRACAPRSTSPAPSPDPFTPERPFLMTTLLETHTLLDPIEIARPQALEFGAGTVAAVGRFVEGTARARDRRSVQRLTRRRARPRRRRRRVRRGRVRARRRRRWTRRWRRPRRPVPRS